jgi:hypothetical protein
MGRKDYDAMPKTESSDPAELASNTWPRWALVLVSILLIWHMAAVVVIGLAAPPSSPLVRGLADKVVWYVQLTDQNHAHRYYSAEPPPTPVVIARLKFSDGRPDRTVRLPDRGTRPRLQYQRELALAHHLSVDYDESRDDEHGSKPSRLAESYARHLCRANPGCAGVKITLERHLIPTLAQFQSAQSAAGARGLDVEAREFYTAPELLGDYACDGH